MLRGASLLLLLPLSAGFQTYQQEIPNGDKVQRNGAAWAGVGHTAAAGAGPRNAFGTDFAAAGKTWTKALCQKDSDGDGVPNGMELGDPGCTWQKGGTPSRTTDISHPGFDDSKPTTAPPPAAPTNSSSNATNSSAAAPPPPAAAPPPPPPAAAQPPPPPPAAAAQPLPPPPVQLPPPPPVAVRPPPPPPPTVPVVTARPTVQRYVSPPTPRPLLSPVEVEALGGTGGDGGTDTWAVLAPVLGVLVLGGVLAAVAYAAKMMKPALGGGAANMAYGSPPPPGAAPHASSTAYGSPYRGPPSSMGSPQRAVLPHQGYSNIAGQWGSPQHPPAAYSQGPPQPLLPQQQPQGLPNPAGSGRQILL